MLKKLMKEHNINSADEVLEAIEFVKELLELQAEEIERNEPYATNSIKAIKEASRIVNDLQYRI